uniref:ML domain-containing protein n=1 Tax=Anopheles funestus TaxID=62324 RepID=A0A182R7E1_ANOFN
MYKFVGRVVGFSFLTLALLACVNLTIGIEFRPCSDGKPQPAIVHIEGCPQMPCDIVRGGNSTMTMVYLAPFDAQILRYVRYFTALGVTAPIPLDPERENGCNWLTGVSCPIRQGDLVISTHVSRPLPIYPLVSAVIEFNILNEQDHVMVCFEYDIRIVVP